MYLRSHGHAFLDKILSTSASLKLSGPPTCENAMQEYVDSQSCKALAIRLQLESTIVTWSLDNLCKLLSLVHAGFPILTQNRNLCESTQCPIAQGPFSGSVQQQIPSATPPVSKHNLTRTAPADCLLFLAPDSRKAYSKQWLFAKFSVLLDLAQLLHR